MAECGSEYLYLVKAGDYTPENRCFGPTIGDLEVAANELCYSKWFDAAKNMQREYVMRRYVDLRTLAFRVGKHTSDAMKAIEATTAEFQRRMAALPKPFGCQIWEYIDSEPHCHVLPLNAWSRINMAVDTMVYGACVLEGLDTAATALDIALTPLPEEPMPTPGDPDAGMDLYDVMLTIGITGILAGVAYGLGRAYIQKKVK